MNDAVWAAVDAYFEAALLGNDTAMQRALEASTAAGLPAIAVSPSQGKLLQLLALGQGAKRILEVGTLGGYSALWLARALRPGGTLVTLEREPRHADVARANFAHAGLSDRIELHVGPALETLNRFVTERVAPFDFVFIDADKPNNLAYVQAALTLSRPGTLIVVDNVVREGEVIAKRRDAAAEGVRRMVEWVGQEAQLGATVVQTVGAKGYDGFLMARVREHP
jgi:predicted O-methyltransferase YrrM